MISWICFEWELASLELPVPSVPPLILRPAEKGEEETALKVLLTAFAMDTAWGDISRRLEEGMGRAAYAAVRGDLLLAKPAPNFTQLCEQAVEEMHRRRGV
jgi:hypothetical protein